MGVALERHLEKYMRESHLMKKNVKTNGFEAQSMSALMLTQSRQARISSFDGERDSRVGIQILVAKSGEQSDFGNIRRSDIGC